MLILKGMKHNKKKHANGVGSTVPRRPYNAAEDTREYGRSRVTNAAARGSMKWLDNVDKRGPVARRFKDLVALVTNDLGGPSELSESKRQIIRRIASLSVWCESQEAVMADGNKIDIAEFGRTANSLRRLCESIGLKRTARDITPSLGSILRGEHA
jgi:hypothetical protein